MQYLHTNATTTSKTIVTIKDKGIKVKLSGNA